MLHMVYPENRSVSEDTVIGWAVDSLVNHNVFSRTFITDEECDSAYQAYISTLTVPSLPEAIAILEDAGECTFTRTASAWTHYEL